TWKARYRAIAISRRETQVRFAADSSLEGTGFEPSVPPQESGRCQVPAIRPRVGRTLTLGGGAEGRDIELSRRKTSVLRPMISARTGRIDDNLGRGTVGANPLPSSAESGTNRRARTPNTQPRLY